MLLKEKINKTDYIKKLSTTYNKDPISSYKANDILDMNICNIYKTGSISIIRKKHPQNNKKRCTANEMERGNKQIITQEIKMCNKDAKMLDLINN